MSAESWAEQVFEAALTDTKLWMRLRDAGTSPNAVKVVSGSQPIGEVVSAAHGATVVAVVGDGSRIELIRIKRL